MRTEVKLNGVYYKLHQGRLPTQTLANQMASKVGQGQSEYGDLTTWSAWIQENWQEGVGRLRPTRNGGFLYGEVDSRVPEQLILPGRIQQVDMRDVVNTRGDCRYMPSSVAGTLTVGTAQTNTRVAAALYTPSGTLPATIKVWMYLRAAQGTVLNFAIYSETASLPNASVVSGTTTVQESTEGFYWYGVSLAYSGTLSASTNYWLVVWPTSGTIEVGYGTNGSFGTNSAGLQGASWTTLGYPVLYTTNAIPMPGSSTINCGSGFVRFKDDSATDRLFLYIRSHLYLYDEANDQWDAVRYIKLTDNVVNSAVPWSWDGSTSVLYFGIDGNGGNHVVRFSDDTWDATVGTAVGPGPYDDSLFASWGGYLYSTRGIKVYYISGEAINASRTSTDEMTTGAWEYPIKGMAGMGDSMYLATDEALYRLAPGDFVVPILPWDSPYDENGRGMVNYQGALYITANNRVVRLTEDHQLQDVWLTREDDLASGRIGRVHDLCVWDKWLVAICASTVSGSMPTIWAYQDNSWHHIATLPASNEGATDTGKNYSLYYDRQTDNLWCATPDNVTYRISTPQFATNPYNDSTYSYAPHAWTEWDWFDSPVLEADKDYDSITIIGENFGAGQTAKLYWKDDASTDWELLGTVDSNIEELRWSIDGGTRPNTKRFKLGMLLSTTDGAQTPRVRAIRVKYHLMVRDWFRWNFQVDVSGRSGALQMTADGTRHTLTASEIKDNIDALCKSVPPFIYTDVDGTEYEVKVIDANFQYTKFEYNESTSNSWWEGVYNLVIEQVTQSEYVAP